MKSYEIEQAELLFSVKQEKRNEQTGQLNQQTRKLNDQSPDYTHNCPINEGVFCKKSPIPGFK